MFPAKRRLGSLFIGFCLLIEVRAEPSTGPGVQYVSPQSGAKFVSPSTTILIRPIGNPDIKSLRRKPLLVNGSKSHSQSGRLMLSDDRQTIIFLPDRPFSPGESVTVSVPSFSLDDGKTVTPFSFGFKITPREAEATALPSIMYELGDKPTAAELEKSGWFKGSQKKVSLGKTLSDSLPLDFPYFRVTDLGDQSPGRIFMSPFGTTSRTTPYLMILETSGSLFFYRRLQASGYDFKVQPNGMLTYFDTHAGYFYGMDSSYKIVDVFKCGNGYATDVHDLQILPNGHALLLGDDPKKVDMSKIVAGGKSNATVIGLVVQEIDRNKNVVFEWRSWDHFQITDATHEDLTAQTIDYVHGNAVQLDTDGNILLSSRHLDEITKINRETGDIIWRWGGKNNQFTFLDDPIGFSHQHDIRRLLTGDITIFDNGNFHTPSFSRAVEYHLDEDAKTAELVWQYRASPDIYGAYMGDVQRLPNGNTFICWGAGSAISEVKPDGSLVFEIQFDPDVYSYRAFRFPWGPSTDERPFVVPTSSLLSQNYPNPFNLTTDIEVNLPEETHVTLKVYDLLGREVVKLADQHQRAGSFFAQFNASGLSSGVYSYRLTTDSYTETRKVVLAK
jgi:hypothetical protein